MPLSKFLTAGNGFMFIRCFFFLYVMHAFVVLG
jgi:hypothetical protein